MYHWYYYTLDNEICIQDNSDGFLTNLDPQGLKEFGLMDSEDNKFIRFFPQEDEMVLEDKIFSLSTSGNCFYGEKNHVQISPDGKERLPPVIYIGYENFMVKFNCEDSTVGFCTEVN